MKVATSTIFDNIIENLYRNMDTMQRLSQVAASGKRINRPSDDPVGTSMALGLRTVLRELEQYKRNIASATSQLKVTESSLMDVNDLLTEAKELAAQMANDTYSPENRRAVATQVLNISEEIMQLTNSQLNGSYLFSGFSTDEEAVTNNPAVDFGVGDPVAHQSGTGTVAIDIANTSLVGQSYPAGTYLMEITEDTADAAANVKFRVSTDGGLTWAATTYDGIGDVAPGDPIVAELDGIVLDLAGSFTAGDRFTLPIHQFALNVDNSAIEVNVGQSATVKRNITATAALEYQSGRTVFDVLDDLRAALINNNTEGIASSLGELDAAQDNLLNQLADVGARLNRMELREGLIDELELQNEQHLSEVEDADLIATITKLENEQVAYQAALKSSQMITQVSLVDYIK